MVEVLTRKTFRLVLKISKIGLKTKEGLAIKLDDFFPYERVTENKLIELMHKRGRLNLL